MSTEAKQTYKLGSNFQISSLSQLKNSSDKDNYTWEGRTLTSWTKHDGDKEHEKVDLDSEINMTSLTSYLSGHWDLNKYGVSVYIPTGGGKVEIKTRNEELPLFSLENPHLSSQELEDYEKYQIYYDSQLSIELKPEEGKYPQSLYVNGVRQPITQTYVYNTYDSVNNEVWKTAGNQFEVSSEYGDNEITDFLSVTSTNGAVCLFDYESLPQPFRVNALKMYNTTYKYVSEPFKQNPNLNELYKFKEINDVNQKVSSLYAGCYGYANCSNLSSISFNGVHALGSQVFQDLTSLVRVDLSSISALYGSYTFYGCKNLVSIDLPNLIIAQCNNSQTGGHFQNCTSLTAINVPNLSSVQSYMFSNCRNLKSIDIPNVIYIDMYGFGSWKNSNYCGISSINCPSLLRLNGINNFAYAKNLISIDISNVSRVPDRSFYSCTSLTNIICPNVTTIDAYAFENCKLTSIYIPKATFINYNAFKNCPLSSIEISNVLTVGNNAFNDCTTISCLNIPYLQSVGTNAFYGFTGLSSVILSSVEFVPYMSNKNTFENTSKGISCYVPDYLFDAFNSSGAWKELGVLSGDGTLDYIKVSTEQEIRLKVNSADGYVNYFKYDDLSGILNVAEFNGSSYSVKYPYSKNVHTNLTSTTSYVSHIYDEYGKLSSIAYKAFYCLYNKSPYEINCSSVLSIGDRAFYLATNLTSVYTPNCISIGKYAFYWLQESNSSRNIYLCLSSVNTVTQIDKTSFTHYSSSNPPISVYVPNYLLDDFQSDENWKYSIEQGYISLISIGD